MKDKKFKIKLSKNKISLDISIFFKLSSCVEHFYNPCNLVCEFYIEKNVK